MYTQNPSAGWTGVRLVTILLLCSLALLIWKPFVVPKDEATGKQLQLPFKDLEESKRPEPDNPKVAPYPYNRRYDEERLGTCIIYGFKAPVDGYYKIPGCYGQPTSWIFVKEGTFLKIGRHWNPNIVAGCKSLSTLEVWVRQKRYGHDKKFPLGRILAKIDDEVVDIPMDIVILDCLEKVTEASCEDLEKIYIAQYGGSENLLLNCCCR